MYNFLTPFRTSVNNETLKSFVRFIRYHKKIKQVDPGIRRRKALLDSNSSKWNNTDFDDLEADFASLGMSHKEHLREVESMKEKEKFLIVKQKYFKDKLPNFLTWADKQQIKYLHGKDPEDWTVEKLSEGFPALPETISKVIKANWTKNSATKIQNHDQSVGKNWKSFKAGQLDLPPDLAAHIKKFSNRQLNLNPIVDPVEKPKLVLPQGEFSDIITSYEKMKKKEQYIGEQVEIQEEKKPLKEVYLSGEVTDIKQDLTLKQYKQVLEHQSNSGIELTTVDKQIISQVKNENISVEPVQEVNLDVVKYVNKSGQVSTFNTKTDCNHLIYPEKIIVPKGKRKRGCTYKLNDCYYDDDGLFLYRVPGME